VRFAAFSDLSKKNLGLHGLVGFLFSTSREVGAHLAKLAAGFSRGEIEITVNTG
jgi:hypothetical protein